jgi:thymidylate synthase (FAD)
MILEKPQIHLEEYDPITIMKNIEKAMRVCYRSENSITSDSYKKLLKMAIESGHESVLEHEKITVQLRCSVGTYKDLTRHRVGTA